MHEKKLDVSMFGGFRIKLGDCEIDDSGNRTRKIWILLAYLFYYHNRTVLQNELTDILWEEGEENYNSTSALRTNFYRARTMLNALGEDAGHDIIIRKNGGYTINPEYTVRLDAEEFGNLIQKASKSEDKGKKLDYLLKALDLYKGDFMSRQSSEPWIRSLSLGFQELYINAVLEAEAFLEEEGRYDEAAEICRKAVKAEPYNEEICCGLMRCLINLQEKSEAVEVYDRISRILLNDFGLFPSEELKKLYFEAMRSVSSEAVPMDEIYHDLNSNDEEIGALICDYNFFKVLYNSAVRLIDRSGASIHVCLLTISPKEDKNVSRKSMDLAVDNLKELIRSSLRRGDAASRCGVSQFIFMLYYANYENSCMVSERIIKAFCRKFPHSPVKIDYEVRALPAGEKKE
ncbi:MAG: BTAD domain-containing putative transcriptional regulator [Bacillota bacterium]|nr:BTAD domain-containing putative transcriptional regulator [Bacillota bacterium]